MAVPITNMKISDIVSALGESTTNITLRNLHLSPKVIGSGLDPTYCSGANGYERLANLRDTANVGGVRSFYIGKFRNYDPVTVNYKQGHFYTHRAFNFQDNDSQVHIPSGWHIPTATEILGIIQTIEPLSNFTNNTVGKHLKSTYVSDDTPFSPSPAWEGNRTNFDTYDFKAMASGICYQGENDGDPIGLTNIGIRHRFWMKVDNTANFAASLSDTDDKLIGIDISSNIGSAFMCHIRLIKDDSTNVGYVEDVEGNIYPTIKIGDYVITSEGIRTTKNKIGGNLTLYNINDSDRYFEDYGYLKITSTDIP
jgi:uncharacterized protein (TIGR02145 family)